MIALLAAVATAAAAATAAPAALAPVLSPAAVVAKYKSALAALKEPRVFAFEYTLQQTGPHTLEQRHRVFRSGADERDEVIAVNGRSTKPLVRIFRGRPYRYTVAALAPKAGPYAFVYAGRHKNGKHVDYVFSLVPKGKPPALAFTQVTIDGVTFLPQAIVFAAGPHEARGSVTFAKSDRYWVARGAVAQAKVPGGVAREQLAFVNWRFPIALPRSTFATARPLPTPPPAAP